MWCWASSTSSRRRSPCCPRRGREPVRPRLYPSDTNDAEWALIEPLLPVASCRTPRGGRPEAHPRRDIVDAIRYLVDSGCKWRSLPADFPPFQAVYGFFARWARAGVVRHLLGELRRAIRVRSGRCPNPVALIIDSQSVKASETMSKATHGYDPGKKVNGRKRTVLVDGGGLPVAVMVTPAGTPDREVARELLWRARLTHPEITLTWADGAYGGELVTWARTFLALTIKVVSRPPGQRGFVVLPRRWVVERTLSWLLRARRKPGY
ncbi:IS5 family transposase [Spongiactinospora rosea]|uniref:IS5 family transposase n=1 Tax=Spongiactinospora rosea TaxID=2248750 RepID=A0A366LS26_9ACTN|nr:IS5 family transposase [Spongiactinospora rosea]